MFSRLVALITFLSIRSAKRSTRHPIQIALLSLLFVFLAPTAICAQADQNSDDVVRVSTDLLVFPVRLSDKRGNDAAALSVNDFKTNDPTGVIKSISFTKGADSVALLFALDQSGSVQDVISQQHEAAVALFKQFGKNSKVAVLRFADAAQLTIPFGDLTNETDAFKSIASPNTHTAIFDAAAKAVDAFQTLPSSRTERRIVILISDGLDNASHTKASSVINQATEKQISFYVIHLPLFEPRDNRLAVRTPSRGFRDLAEKTGGKYFLAAGPGGALNLQNYDLSPIFKAIEEDLKSQYLLGFYLNENARDGQRHMFSVSLTLPDVKYSVSNHGFSRTQKFFVALTH